MNSAQTVTSARLSSKARLKLKVGFKTTAGPCFSDGMDQRRQGSAVDLSNLGAQRPLTAEQPFVTPAQVARETL